MKNFWWTDENFLKGGAKKCVSNHQKGRFLGGKEKTSKSVMWQFVTINFGHIFILRIQALPCKYILLLLYIYIYNNSFSFKCNRGDKIVCVFLIVTNCHVTLTNEVTSTIAIVKMTEQLSAWHYVKNSANYFSQPHAFQCFTSREMLISNWVARKVANRPSDVVSMHCDRSKQGEGRPSPDPPCEGGKLNNWMVICKW